MVLVALTRANALLLEEGAGLGGDWACRPLHLIRQLLARADRDAVDRLVVTEVRIDELLVLPPFLVIRQLDNSTVRTQRHVLSHAPPKWLLVLDHLLLLLLLLLRNRNAFVARVFVTGG